VVGRLATGRGRVNACTDIGCTGATIDVTIASNSRNAACWRSLHFLLQQTCCAKGKCKCL
jgi:hypothetical protein